MEEETALIHTHVRGLYLCCVGWGGVQQCFEVVALSVCVCVCVNVELCMGEETARSFTSMGYVCARVLLVLGQGGGGSKG